MKSLSFDDFSKIIDVLLLFLVNDYHFNRQEKKYIYGTYITFSLADMQISFCYGAPEYAANISFSFENAKKSFSLGELLETGFFNWDWNEHKQYCDKCKNAISDIKVYQVFLKKNIDKILISKKQIAAKLTENSQRRESESSQQEKINEIRVEADNAWKEKKYKALVELYTQIKSRLTVTELKKIESCKNKLK